MMANGLKESISTEKRDRILAELQRAATKEYGEVPREGSNTVIFCLYGPGSFINWQPDGLVIHRLEGPSIVNSKRGHSYSNPEGDFVVDEYVMTGNGELKKVSSTISSLRTTPRDRILKAILTGKISKEEMNNLRQEDAKSRSADNWHRKHFTDWNQELLMKEAERIYTKNQPLADAVVLESAALLFGAVRVQ